MSKEASDPSTSNEGNPNAQRSRARVSHLDTSSSTKTSASDGVAAINLLDNGVTHLAKSTSPAIAERVSSHTSNSTRHTTDTTSYASKKNTRRSHVDKHSTRCVTKNTDILDDDSNNASIVKGVLVSKIPTMLAKRAAKNYDVWDHFRVLLMIVSIKLMSACVVQKIKESLDSNSTEGRKKVLQQAIHLSI